MFFTCNPCCSQDGPIAKSERSCSPFEVVGKSYCVLCIMLLPYSFCSITEGFLDRKRKAAVVDHHVWQSSALMRHNIDSVPPVQPDVNEPVFA
ncbi:hypothetical protein HanPI659440_Chr01g0007931 [Helianthus annuus]|nr:hypothetical protein HanPI659440_Chr01g0007931 [Helianthus annuus]